jgi:hypothetical protein
MNTTKFSIPINQDQVNNLLKYVDATQDETVKASIFTQLGHDCFFSRHHDQWIDSFDGDVQRFLDNINIEHKSTFWESLVFSADKSRLILTGKEVDGCACSFAACSAPPLSLCNYCCKGFQKALFSYLLGKQVEVTITESYLLGHKRCSTIIDIV